MWLAFETGSHGGSLALSDGTCILQQVDLHGEDPARFLVPYMVQLFQQITPQDLTYVIVPYGPGSFTGIRLGLAAAYGLCLGTKAQLCTVHRADVLYSMLPQEIREDACDIAIAMGGRHVWVKHFPAYSLWPFQSKEQAISVEALENLESVLIGDSTALGSGILYQPLSATDLIYFVKTHGIQSFTEEKAPLYGYIGSF